MNLFLELSEGFFDSTDRRELNFCVYLSYFHDFRSREMLIHAIPLFFFYFIGFSKVFHALRAPKIMKNKTDKRKI